MPRIESWIKTRVSDLVKPRHQKKLTTKDIKISNPILDSSPYTGWAPVLRSRSMRSSSVEDLVSTPPTYSAFSSFSTASSSAASCSLSTSSSDSRRSSVSSIASNASGITIIVHSPDLSASPTAFFASQTSVPRRETPIMISPFDSYDVSPRTRHAVLFCDPPSPPTYFKSNFGFSTGSASEDPFTSAPHTGDYELLERRFTRSLSEGLNGLKIVME